jgi:transglutaminase-like putative cysteine protease
MIYDVSHRTTYSYGRPVLQSEHLVHLTPRSGPCQTLHRHNLLIEPAPSSNVPWRTISATAAPSTTIEDEHSELVIHARSTVEVFPHELPMHALTTPWEQVTANALRGSGVLDIGVLQFVSASRHTRVVREAIDYARPSFPPGRPILEAALDLTERIYGDFVFDSAATDISTPVSHVLRLRRGVCQDFAHLAITCLRALRLPARYISGYLLTHPSPGAAKLAGGDASHAWFSVWTPEADGSIRSTNGIMPSTSTSRWRWGATTTT